MKVFITGATGYIGGSLAVRLKQKGHAVRGLVRSLDKIAGLAAQGMEPVSGTLDDTGLLRREAQAADVVINAASSDHLGAIEALLDGLAGSGKPFLHTSGTSLVADDAQGAFGSDRVFDEETRFTPRPERAARVALNQVVLDAAARDVRSVVLCNSLIYGNGLGLAGDSVQIPPLVAQARASGIVRTVGAGLNVWSNVHLEDMLDLYELALARAPAGELFFVENGAASFLEIGQAIARRFGLGGPDAWSVAEAAAAWGGMRAALSLGSNSRVTSGKARRELGWTPGQLSVTDWIKQEM